MNPILTLPRAVTFLLGLMAGILFMSILLLVLGLDLSWFGEDFVEDWMPIASIGVMFGGLLVVVVMGLSVLLEGDAEYEDGPAVEVRETYGACDDDVPTPEEFQNFMRNRKRGVQ